MEAEIETNSNSSITDINFFSGGNATFTISKDGGDHYTFKINQPDEDKPFFVSLLTGSDNESSYTYLGVYNPIHQKVYLGKKSTYKEDSIPVKAIRWAIAIILSGKELPVGWSVQHEGNCCVCGKKLTTPDSINKGIGPYCEKRRNF